MSQEHYIDDLQTQFLNGCHISVPTPTDVYLKDLISRTVDKDPLPGPYPSLIGGLLWVAHCTRADVSFAVNRISQFLRDLSSSHWKAAVRVLNYLVTTKHLCLRLGGTLKLSGYSDVDWDEYRGTRHSTSAYTHRIGDSLISWKSRKQATVLLSSTKAEYKALSHYKKCHLYA